MRHVDSSQQIDLENTWPVAWLQVPEREPERARAGSDGKYDMIDFPDAIGEGPHLVIRGDVPLDQPGARGQRRLGVIPVKAVHMAALADERLRDCPADAASRPKDSYPLSGQIQLHAGGGSKSAGPLARRMNHE